MNVMSEPKNKPSYINTRHQYVQIRNHSAHQSWFATDIPGLWEPATKPPTILTEANADRQIDDAVRALMELSPERPLPNSLAQVTQILWRNTVHIDLMRWTAVGWSHGMQFMESYAQTISIHAEGNGWVVKLEVPTIRTIR